MALDSQDPHEVWAQCLLNIERRVKAQSFSNWFRPTQIIQFDRDLLVIQVPSIVSADWLEKHYVSLIGEVVQEETELSPVIQFTIEGSSSYRKQIQADDSFGKPPPQPTSNCCNPGE